MSIEIGRGVILKKGKNLKYVCVSESKQEKMGNFYFNCSDMIGKPYGTAFKVIDKKKLEVIDPVLVEEHAEEYQFENENLEHTEDDMKDNRSIQDNPDSQKLSKDEIMTLREEGKSGEEIIQELVQNSATFNDRTEFSKAKYLKKKKKKYIAQFVALRPTARLLAEMYFFKNPLKILEIRPDSLAQILTWSNVQSNSNVLLVDTCQGFVAGAILERLGTDGQLVQLYQGSFPVRIIMEQFNFSVDDVKKNVSSFPLDKIAGLEKLFENYEKDEDSIELIFGKGKEEKKEISEVVETKSSMDVDECDINETKDTTENKDVMQGVKKFQKNRKRKNDPDNKDEGGEPRKSRVAFISREERIKECLTAMKYLRAKNFSSLVIASKYHPKNLLFPLLEFLPRACPFVVYFTHQEPLMDCYVTLRERNIATNVEVTETWYRNIQVLPNRTHPEIVMSATGGYILRGVTVDNM